MKKATENTTLVEILRNAGFRATTQRKLVLAYLQQSKYPQSVKEVIDGVGSKNIDQVTAYRILEAFKKAGLVNSVDFRHGHTHYEIKDEQHDHHHLICIGCDRVEDFTGCDSDHLANKALKQTKGFAQVTSHSLELFGLCNTCVEQGKKLQAA